MSPAPGARGAADPAPARPRRSRRHAEVRLRRRSRRARTGIGPGDGGPGGGGRCRQGAARRSSASRSSATWCSWARPRRSERERPTPTDLDAVDESPVRCFDPDGGGGDDRRDQGGGEGRRLPRRRRRGARLRRAGRPRQPRPLGPQDRRAARPGDDEHPGGEGASRSATGSRSPAGAAARPTTRSCWDARPATTGASRRWPAASKAG